MRKTSLWPKSDPFYKELLADHNDLTRMMVELIKELSTELDDPSGVYKKVRGLNKWMGQQNLPKKYLKKGKGRV